MADLFRPARQPRVPKVKAPTPSGFRPTGMQGSVPAGFLGAPPKSAAPAPAPAASSSPAPDAGASYESDPVYQATLKNLGLKRATTLAQIPGEQTSTLASYGYTADLDPNTGMPTNIQFDPNNPYSQASLLRKHYVNSQAAARTNYAARGFGRSGVAEAAVGTLNDQQQQGENALTNALVKALAGIGGQRTQALTDYEIGSGDAQGAAAGRASAQDTGLSGLAPPAAVSPTVPAVAAAPRTSSHTQHKPAKKPSKKK